MVLVDVDSLFSMRPVTESQVDTVLLAKELSNEALRGRSVYSNSVSFPVFWPIHGMNALYIVSLN